MKSAFFISLCCFFAQVAFATQAQPVPVPEDQSLTPQIEISGVGISTLSASRAGPGGSSQAGINFSDSALMFGAAQRLGDQKSIGSTGLGWLTLDDTNKGLQTQLFLNQAFLPPKKYRKLLAVVWV